ncbi:hypothetical protein MJH12_14090, partial [bacterium]|nr:hypothetical protein [bacterium]
IDSFESLIFIINANATSTEVGWSDSEYRVIISPTEFHLKLNDARPAKDHMVIEAFGFRVLAKFNKN